MRYFISVALAATLSIPPAAAQQQIVCQPISGQLVCRQERAPSAKRVAIGAAVAVGVTTVVLLASRHRKGKARKEAAHAQFSPKSQGQTKGHSSTDKLL